MKNKLLAIWHIITARQFFLTSQSGSQECIDYSCDWYHLVFTENVVEEAKWK